MNLKDYIRSIPDYPKKGILFRDITTLIKDENAFAETINQIIKRSKKYNFTKIAAIESRGFVFASAVSYVLKKPFNMLRKKNKLPADVHSVDFELEYGTATIEVHKDSINEKDNVLIIDDLIATGGTAEAAARLIEISGIITSLLGILLSIALISYSPEDPNFIFPENTNIKNFLGFKGSYISDLFLQSVGLTSYLIPITIFFTGLNVFKKKQIFIIIENLFFVILYMLKTSIHSLLMKLFYLL